MSLAMASSLAGQGRTHVVSRAKKTPSPSVSVPKTPSRTLTDSKKRLNSSDGSSKRHTTPKSPFRVERSSTTTVRPSDRLNPKTVDPFNDKTPKSSFAAVYANGGVPCRLVHGSVKHKLSWDVPPENLQYDPILVTLAEGLRETKHPYTFVAREGFKQMLEVDDANTRVTPIVSKLILPLRAALSSQDLAVFDTALNALTQLSSVVGDVLIPHLKTLLPHVSRRFMDKTQKEKIVYALQQIERNCGKESLPIIKLKIPTYSSVCS